jgi:hypothetical protein
MQIYDRFLGNAVYPCGLFHSSRNGDQVAVDAGRALRVTLLAHHVTSMEERPALFGIVPSFRIVITITAGAAAVS